MKNKNICTKEESDTGIRLSHLSNLLFPNLLSPTYFILHLPTVLILIIIHNLPSPISNLPTLYSDLSGFFHLPIFHLPSLCHPLIMKVNIIIGFSHEKNIMIIETKCCLPKRTLFITTLIKTL